MFKIPDDFPNCCMGSCMPMDSMKDLCFIARCELDLVEEGEDTELTSEDVRECKEFLRKYRKYDITRKKKGK